MYAILKTGGKQYTVKENDIIEVEKLEVAEGEEVILNDVLFISGDNGPSIGTPTVPGAQITGKVIRQGLGKKIVGFTYKKGNQHRRFGHRQPFTQIKIEKISL